jgi:autotransporter strand-loop-strand O-heptosyltransferase
MYFYSMCNNMKIYVNYVTDNPIEGDAPKVYLIDGDPNEIYRVEFIDSNKKKVLYSILSNTNNLLYGKVQWCINWEIKVYKNNSNELIYINRYDAKNKVVFIKIDGYALGDNIAWIPYVEEFRKKHNCTVICSTFYNYIFKNIYPEILFVQPNISIDNVYSQHYIGASSKNRTYSPINYEDNPLQKVASSILGLEHREIRPKLENNILNSKPRIEGKYVCISEHASHEKKHWKEVQGWQKVVNLLKSEGYKVAVISREPTNLEGVIDLTGDRDLFERMIDLYHSDFYIGVSSGLSWLAWSLNKKVIMISDCTPSWCEFKENNFRVIKNEISEINYETKENSSFKSVSNVIYNVING